MKQVEIGTHDLLTDGKNGFHLVSGKRLGKYRLQKRLGRGGIL